MTSETKVQKSEIVVFPVCGDADFYYEKIKIISLLKWPFIFRSISFIIGKASAVELSRLESFQKFLKLF